MTRGTRLFGLMLAVAGICACRQLVGITDSPPEDLSSMVDGLPFGTTACASCAGTNCSAESTSCAANQVCSAYEGCLGTCNGGPACRSQCTVDNQLVTASEVSALSSCLASHCEVACGLGCGGVAAYVSEPPFADSCQSCIEQTTGACTDARAWGTSVDGDAYWRCVLACPTEDCKLTCGTDHPSGASLFATFQTDYAGTCSGPCAYGKYWACVGQVNWPAAKATTIMGSFSVADQNGSPVSGLDVSFCSLCPCGSAADPMLGNQYQTDDAGTVEYTIPQVLDRNGIGLDGCVQVASPDRSYIPVFASGAIRSASR